MANPQNIQIGIDLGTTNSSVAINNNGNIEIVKNTPYAVSRAGLFKILEISFRGYDESFGNRCINFCKLA